MAKRDNSREAKAAAYQAARAKAIQAIADIQAGLARLDESQAQAPDFWTWVTTAEEVAADIEYIADRLLGRGEYAEIAPPQKLGFPTGRSF